MSKELNLSIIKDIIGPDKLLNQQIQMYQPKQFLIHSPRGLLNQYTSYRGYQDILEFYELTKIMEKSKESPEYKVFSNIFKYDTNSQLKSEKQIEDDYINHIIYQLRLYINIFKYDINEQLNPDKQIEYNYINNTICQFL